MTDIVIRKKDENVRTVEELSQEELCHIKVYVYSFTDDIKFFYQTSRLVAYIKYYWNRIRGLVNSVRYWQISTEATIKENFNESVKSLINYVQQMEKIKSPRLPKMKKVQAMKLIKKRA